MALKSVDDIEVGGFNDIEVGGFDDELSATETDCLPCQEL